MFAPQLPPRLNIRINEQDLARLRRRLRTYANNLKKEFTGLPSELAYLGQQYARGIAPVMSGTLLQAIRWRTNTKDEAILRVDKATLNTNPINKQNPYFTSGANYAAIMHLNNGAMGRGVHIYSGDPQFMFTTRDYLAKVMRAKIQVKLGKL